MSSAVQMAAHRENTRGRAVLATVVSKPEIRVIVHFRTATLAYFPARFQILIRAALRQPLFSCRHAEPILPQPAAVGGRILAGSLKTMGAKHFGARIARLEDPALLTGQGRFVDDIQLPGALQ